MYSIWSWTKIFKYCSSWSEMWVVGPVTWLDISNFWIPDLCCSCTVCILYYSVCDFGLDLQSKCTLCLHNNVLFCTSHLIKELSQVWVLEVKHVKLWITEFLMDIYWTLVTQFLHVPCTSQSFELSRFF